METTFSILETQIAQRLSSVNHYEPIYINQALAEILDSYDIPQEAKLACLTIDTAMRHLDEVSTTLSSKKSILIGDLLSAHFYTLLAKLNDPIYQKEISTAIVEVNEMKSSIHHDAIDNNDISDYILKVENTFPFITIKRYVPEVNINFINEKMIASLAEHHPSYLGEFSKEKLDGFIDKLKAEIHSKRGN